MHIEPGLISPEKIVLSYATAAASFAFAGKLVVDHLRHEAATSFIAKAAIATVAVFVFFEVFFHFPVGVSEVHFILATSLLLLLGVAPTAVGLSLGLLLQGLFFAPADLPQYAANVTTLLVPLFFTAQLGKRIIPGNLPYVDLSYRHVLQLSLAYQGGVIAWVTFWAFYGQGFAIASAVATFGAAYLTVVLIEPVADLALLAGAKAGRRFSASPWGRLVLHPRLFAGATRAN